MKSKFIRTGLCFVMLCSLFAVSGVFAQENKAEDFMYIEFENEPVAVQDEMQSLQSSLSELEYYFSELKAQEIKALNVIPEKIKNKKFKSTAEKAAHYKKVSNEYISKFSNDELNKQDIKISENLAILSELYTTEVMIQSLKKEIKDKQ